MIALSLIVAVLLCLNHFQTLAYQFSRETVLQPFVQGKAFKVIAGLNNFDARNVRQVASAAEHGGATHLDIACEEGLIKMTKEICQTTPLCVSAIKPTDFLKAIRAGADMIEIGNFDGFYEAGLRFSAEDILQLTRETRSLVGIRVPLSVTVPHTLPLPEQIVLAKELERLSVDVIQTEGKMRVDPSAMGVEQLIEKAAPSLAAAFALSRAVKIPVMCASGLSDVTVPMALAAGAKGVGIGSAINRLKDEQQMLVAVSAIADAMGISRSSRPSQDYAVSIAEGESEASEASNYPKQRPIDAFASFSTARHDRHRI